MAKGNTAMADLHMGTRGALPPPLKTKIQANLPTSNKNTDHDRKSDLFKTKV